MSPVSQLLFVVDTYSNNVFVFLQNGTGLGPLRQPSSGTPAATVSIDLFGLAFSPAGDMFLAESASNQIILYNFTAGASVFATGPQIYASGGTAPNTPVDVQLGPLDNCTYVSSHGSHSVRRRPPAARRPALTSRRCFVSAPTTPPWCSLWRRTRATCWRRWCAARARAGDGAGAGVLNRRAGNGV
jgi:hypothetical protein